MVRKGILVKKSSQTARMWLWGLSLGRIGEIGFMRVIGKAPITPINPLILINPILLSLPGAQKEPLPVDGKRR